MTAKNSSTIAHEKSEKRTQHGVLSFGLGVFSILTLVLLAYVAVNCLYGCKLPLDIDVDLIFNNLFCINIVSAVIGLGFGIAVILLDKPRRGLAIVGIVFSSLTILVYIAILVSSLV